MSEVLVVGSVAYDTISTPFGRVDRTLGGSANYFSLAASLYSKVNIVGVVGDDYEDQDLSILKNRNVDLSGLKSVPGKTFHWEGEYKEDMNEATTLVTDLNVFENFNPILPDSYKESSHLFLANIDPTLQKSVLDQVSSPCLIAADTMNFWINSKITDLKNLLERIDVLLVNEGEAKALSGEHNAIAAAKTLNKMGPHAIVIKRGEYGFILYQNKQYFVLPAFPIAQVIDPTGAGDTFAAGFMGYLSKVGAQCDMDQLKKACVHGCILASFTVENFGVQTLVELNESMVEARLLEYKSIIS